MSAKWGVEVSWLWTLRSDKLFELKICWEAGHFTCSGKKEMYLHLTSGGDGWMMVVGSAFLRQEASTFLRSAFLWLQASEVSNPVPRSTCYGKKSAVKGLVSSRAFSRTCFKLSLGPAEGGQLQCPGPKSGPKGPKVWKVYGMMTLQCMWSLWSFFLGSDVKDIKKLMSKLKSNYIFSLNEKATA